MVVCERAMKLSGWDASVPAHKAVAIQLIIQVSRGISTQIIELLNGFSSSCQTIIGVYTSTLQKSEDFSVKASRVKL